MKSITTIVLLIGVTLELVAAFAPIHTTTFSTTSRSTTHHESLQQLNLFFGNNKKDTESSSSSSKKSNVNADKKNKKNVSSLKKKTATETKKEPAWKKGARMAVTGSLDGVALIGKPQYDWNTGKPMKRPGAFDWSSSYKKRDNNTKGKK